MSGGGETVVAGPLVGGHGEHDRRQDTVGRGQIGGADRQPHRVDQPVVVALPAAAQITGPVRSRLGGGEDVEQGEQAFAEFRRAVEAARDGAVGPLVDT